MSNASKVWFITGISRGLGRALAKAALALNHAVIGTTRNGQSDLQAPQLRVLPLEVTDAAQVESVVRQAHEIHGRLDFIVNNAGYGLLGAIEEASDEEVRHVFEVNFFGTLNVIRSALPLLRAQRSGHIVNFSSIAGVAPAAGSGIYAATKFAVEGLSQSLAREVTPLGIKVTVVEPGAFRTDFLSEQSVRITQRKIPDYAPTSGATVSYLAAANGKQLGNPDAGARAIIEAVQSENPPLNLLLGSDALRRTRERLQQFTDTISHWEPLTLSTDHGKDPSGRV